MKIFFTIVLSLFVMVLSALSQTTYTATATGLWSTMTWSPAGTPGALDNVVIPDADTVTIDQNIEINDLTIGGGISGSLQFSKLVTSAVIINGNILIQAGGGFKVQTNGNPSPTGNFVHTLDLKGNLTHNGNLLDFRSGSAGSTLAVCNLTLSGSSNNTLIVSTAYSSTNGDFNAVTINKTGAGKVILGSNIVMSGGSSTGPAIANSIMTFVNGIIETGDYIWICLTSTEANVVGYDATSYIKGAMGRGMSNSAASSKNFPIGDATGFRPFKLYSSTAGTATGHYAIVRCVTGNANTGTSTFNSLIDKVSEVRYYQIGYNKLIVGNRRLPADNMGFKNFRPSYGTDDGVIAGNTDLRVAYSSDARATWNGITQAVAHTTVITDTFTVITPDTLGNAPNGPVVTLTSGSSMYVALARATGTTTNPLSSPKVLTLTALIEGLRWHTMVSDTVNVELRNTSPGYGLVDQAKVVLNSTVLLQPISSQQQMQLLITLLLNIAIQSATWSASGNHSAGEH